LFIENSSLVSSKHLEISADFLSDNQLKHQSKNSKNVRSPFHKDE
jgi:hypothetical protein